MISSGYCNKVPQMGWLKQLESVESEIKVMIGIEVLEAQWRICPTSLLDSDGWQRSSTFIGLLDAPLKFLPSSSYDILFLSVYLCSNWSPFIRIAVIGLESTLAQCDVNLIISIKTLGAWVFRGHHSTHTELSNRTEKWLLVLGWWSWKKSFLWIGRTQNWILEIWIVSSK